MFQFHFKIKKTDAFWFSERNQYHGNTDRREETADWGEDAHLWGSGESVWREN